MSKGCLPARQVLFKDSRFCPCIMERLGAKDDAPDTTTLALLAAVGGHVGEIVFA